jgi:hypothetical protein
MEEYVLPYFGTIAMNSLEEYYSVEIEFQGGQLEIDINFENKTTGVEKMDAIKRMVEGISSFDANNRVYIAENYNAADETTVKDYIEFHVEECREELSEFVDFGDKTLDHERQLLKNLTLHRVGLYPDGKYGATYFAAFDYTLLGLDISGELIVVKTDESGALDHIAHES